MREHRDGYGNITHSALCRRADRSYCLCPWRAASDQIGPAWSTAARRPAAALFSAPDAAHHCGAGAFSDLAAAREAQRGTTLDKLQSAAGTYPTRMTFEPVGPRPTPPRTEAFSAGHGVCRISPHLIAVARAGRIRPATSRATSSAATEPKSRSGPCLGGRLWGGSRLVAFDPTNGICADDAYIRVAGGLDIASRPLCRGTQRERPESSARGLQVGLLAPIAVASRRSHSDRASLRPGRKARKRHDLLPGMLLLPASS